MAGRRDRPGAPRRGGALRPGGARGPHQLGPAPAQRAMEALVAAANAELAQVGAPAAGRAAARASTARRDATRLVPPRGVVRPVRPLQPRPRAARRGARTRGKRRVPRGAPCRADVQGRAQARRRGRRRTSIELRLEVRRRSRRRPSPLRSPRASAGSGTRLRRGVEPRGRGRRPAVACGCGRRPARRGARRLRVRRGGVPLGAPAGVLRPHRHRDAACGLRPHSRARAAAVRAAQRTALRTRRVGDGRTRPGRAGPAGSPPTCSTSWTRRSARSGAHRSAW